MTSKDKTAQEWSYGLQKGTWSSRLRACRFCRKDKRECIVRFRVGNVVLCDNCRRKRKPKKSCTPNFDESTMQKYKARIEKRKRTKTDEESDSSDEEDEINDGDITDDDLDDDEQTRMKGRAKRSVDESEKGEHASSNTVSEGEMKPAKRFSFTLATHSPSPASTRQAVESGCTLASSSRMTIVDNSDPVPIPSNTHDAGQQSGGTGAHTPVAHDPTPPAASRDEHFNNEEYACRRATPSDLIEEDVLSDLASAGEALEVFQRSSVDGKIASATLCGMWEKVGRTLRQGLALLTPRSQNEKKLSYWLGLFDAMLAPVDGDGQVDLRDVQSLFRAFQSILEDSLSSKEME